MNPREQRFKYRLESLMGLRSAERDALAFEARATRHEVQAKRRDLDRVARAIESAQSELRRLYAGAGNLSVARQIGLQQFLKQQRERYAALQAELANAEQAAERVRGALQDKARDAAVLEKHRERVVRRLDADAARAASRAADDDWLGRKRPRGTT